MQNKSIIITLAVIITIALASAGYTFTRAGTSMPSQGQNASPQGRVIEEKLVIPDTASFAGMEGRSLTRRGRRRFGSQTIVKKSSLTARF